MYNYAKSHKTAGKMGKPTRRFRSPDKVDNGWRGERLPFVRHRTKGRLQPRLNTDLIPPKSLGLGHRYCMRFSDFVIFDAAAQAVFTDLAGQRAFRLCLARLAETARRNPGTLMAEATASRKGVAFKQKALDDTEHAIFAQRLADRLHTKPKQGAYGDFLRHSVLQQGQVLGDMNWDTWEVTKKISGTWRRRSEHRDQSAKLRPQNEWLWSVESTGRTSACPH